jgi:hypothetical protein
LVEEIGDPQEEIEVAGVHQESPLQIRDSPEIQVTPGMAELLYQQSQLLMKWMQDDSYLIVTPALSTSIQSVPTEPSGPGSLNPNNTNRIKYPWIHNIVGQLPGRQKNSTRDRSGVNRNTSA